MYHVSIKKYKPRCGFFEKKGKLEVSDFSVKITSAKVFELSFINTHDSPFNYFLFPLLSPKSSHAKYTCNHHTHNCHETKVSVLFVPCEFFKQKKKTRKLKKLN